MRVLRSVLLGLLALVPALAAAVEGELTAYRVASERFATLTAAAEAAKSPALLQGGEAEQLVALLSDAPRFLDARGWGVADLADLLDVCGRSNRAVMSLGLFDLKSHLGPKSTAEEAAQQTAAQFDRNARIFAPELTRLQPFLLHCSALEVAPMARFIGTLKPAEWNDARRQGLVQFRSGLEQLLTGVLRSAGDPRYDEGYRLAVVQALAADASALAGGLPVAQRKALRPEADAALSAAPDDFAPPLKAIAAALADERCEGLCGY
jgi:hypothetical protein